MIFLNIIIIIKIGFIILLILICTCATNFCESCIYYYKIPVLNLKRIFLILLLLSLSQIFAQKLYYSFDHITLEDGISSNSIYSIHQDKMGFIWMGSSKGLDKYDGYKVKNYKQVARNSYLKIGNKDNEIGTITSDNDSNLWIGTTFGLIKFNLKNEKITNYFTKFDTNGYNINSVIIHLIFDSTSNSVWGGKDGNIFRLNVKTDEVIEYKYDSLKKNGVPKTGLMKIIHDKQGNLWFTFWDYGISKYDRKNDTFVHYTHNPKDPESIFQHEVFGIESDSKGNIWVATLNNNSVCKLDTKTQKFQHFSSNKYANIYPFWNVVADKSDKLWFNSAEAGISIYQPNSDIFTLINHESNNPESLSESRAATATLLDKNDNMWIATMNKGVNKTDLKLSSVNYFPINNNLLNKTSFVNSIVEIDNSIWVSNADGVFCLDLKTHQYKKIEIKNQKSNIRKLINLHNGNILAVSLEESYLINTTSLNSIVWKVDFLKNKIFVSASYKDSTGKIWLVTKDYIYVFENNSYKKIEKKIKLPKISVFEYFYYTCFLEDTTNITINVETELMVFDKKNIKPIKNSSMSTDFSSFSRVTSINLKNDSTYLFDVNGWRKYDKNYKFSEHQKYDFLYPDEVNPIGYAYNDSMICITTYRGIFIYNIKSKKYIHPKVFNPDMINPDVFIKSKDNKTFYMSAGTGIVSFVPSELEKTSYIPEIVLSDFQLFNQSVFVDSSNSPLKEAITFCKEIVLNYDQNIFSIEMAILNFDEVARNQFMYKMDGIDSDWNNIGNRRVASFTNLSPGKYTFRYKGKDKNDNQTSEKSINITVLPPFWATWWFRILAFGLVILILYTIYKVRINNIKNQKIELEHQVILRTSEILSQKEEILAQKEDIEEHEKRITELYEDIKDSITTAQRIQESILPPESLIKQCLPQSYVLYLPKDIVSGDFYWFHVDVDRFYIAAVDCTGHGVAGAFMSLIAHNLLNRIIKDERNLNPKQVLDRLNSYVIQVLHQESEHPISKDGMDISICMVLPEQKEIHVSGANNGIYYIRNGNLEQIRANKNSVGVQPMGKMASFENFSMPYQSGDKFYMFSDGFAGQFGGLNGNEKMKYNRFRENLTMNSHLPMNQQKESLHHLLKDFQRGTEQTDDILVIGFEL